MSTAEWYFLLKAENQFTVDGADGAGSSLIRSLGMVCGLTVGSGGGKNHGKGQKSRTGPVMYRSTNERKGYEWMLTRKGGGGQRTKSDKEQQTRQTERVHRKGNAKAKAATLFYRGE